MSSSFQQRIFLAAPLTTELGVQQVVAPIGDDDQPSTAESVFWQISKQHSEIMAIKTHKTCHDSRAVQTCVMA